MKILVYAEHDQGTYKGSVFEALGKLSEHGDVEAVVCGEAPDPKSLGAYGAKKVHVLKDDQLKSFTSEGYSQAIAQLVEKESFNWVFAAASTQGKDLMPRLAARLDGAMASDVTGLEKEGDGFQFTRPIYAGKVIQKVKFKGDAPKCVTIRPNVFPVGEASGSDAEVQEHSDLSLDIKSKVIEIKEGEQSGALDLTEARVVISGGRSLKNGENFKILWDLSEKIEGSTVGASRAAVDAGFAPHSMQVGQTGKTVSPQLYIAFGISGAIQHLAGMRTSKTIVAINTDENAPIFQKADYGIVGDLFEIAPLMTKALS